ncbi:MAG: hypothetical protein COW71_11080 [Ignavibacteriales bacterium CG18_big_fil_WC_8_21_14_2_50_31_20]|nr:MAG: hypothetical protein COW71_11080 [Ignavibacteriales bacterium CG18_big_fil_WC_8_21_14_2_50_31_20]
MNYFHIKYIEKKRVFKHVFLAENEVSAKNIFANKIIKNRRSEISVLDCKRSSKIEKNKPSYCIKDAKWIVYQNLSKKVQKKLTIKEIKIILNYFFKYLEENGFVKDNRVIAHLKDENIPSIYEGQESVVSALDVCSFVQFEAIVKQNKLFSFDDIYNVFVAETKYLKESGLV